MPPHGRRLSDNGSDHFLEAVGSWFCAGVAVARPAGLGEAGRPPSGPLLALLKYPFYPLFILDNGMNLISKSLTVLTPA